MSDVTTVSEARLAPPYRERRSGLLGLYDATVSAAVGLLDGWFTGLVARFAIFSVLGMYYLSSAWKGLDGSLANLFSPTDSTFITMFPQAFEAAGYDTSALAFFPYTPVAVLGTIGELVLPILVLVGLFTRIAAVGLAIVVAVQSYVDVTGHGLDEKSIGAPFDRLPDAVIWDQRLLWIALLAILAVRGPGLLSIDAILRRSSRD